MCFQFLVRRELCPGNQKPAGPEKILVPTTAWFVAFLVKPETAGPVKAATAEKDRRIDGAPEVGEMAKQSISITVNGRSTTVTVEPDTRAVVRAARRPRVSRGPKFGCGLSQCGACTVTLRREGRALVPSPRFERRCEAGRRRSRDSGTPQAPHRVQAAVHRRTGRAMRLLYPRHDDVRGRAARIDAASDRCGDRRGADG